jgi:2-oxoglutarate ferredoxin oxidoreductase subunit beta
MNTYGFHTIHGRAPAVATGVKLANPDLSVWVVTGDGDGLSIGGNHLIHCMRRNVDLKILMFNNRIYGLTKGQFSPTSERGKKTKSSPLGTVDRPFQPLTVALGADCTFVARSIDVQAPHLRGVLKRAAEHHGTAFVEILQNCNIFNDHAWEAVTDKEVRDDAQLVLEHGKPLRFGKGRSRGLRLRGLELEVVNVADVGEEAILVHDETNKTLGFLLSRMEPPAFPTPVGVVLAVKEPTCDEGFVSQLDEAITRQGPGDLEKLLNSGDTWVVA